MTGINKIAVYVKVHVVLVPPCQPQRKTLGSINMDSFEVIQQSPVIKEHLVTCNTLCMSLRIEGY